MKAILASVESGANTVCHAVCCCSSLARAELDSLPSEVADQARFIIQAQALIDPDEPGKCVQTAFSKVPDQSLTLPVKLLTMR